MQLALPVFALLLAYVGFSLAVYERNGRVEESMALPGNLQSRIVRKHNNLRRKVDPPATNMKTIRWDDELARSAMNWARCYNWFQHSSDYSYGENLYVSYNRELVAAVKNALQLWWKEKEDYDYYSNQCGWGKVCGHYTQMAWADTYAIGCGYARNCPGQSMDFYLVCQYKEAGNMMGEKPYSIR